jgi:hypothetical protein
MVTSLFAAQWSMAASVDVWEGPGAQFDVSGNATSTYDLVVENERIGDQIQSHVTIALPGGTTLKQQCLMTKTSADAWSSTCDHGVGGGRCFGEGLCISYESAPAGKAFATTIVFDGASEMCLLRTELQNGQAVRFYREKLHKK